MREHDPIPEGELGASRDVPFVKPPDDFQKNGVPYGAWCKCSECSRVFRSTTAFDCYPTLTGFLICEACVQEKGRSQVRDRNKKGNVICPHCYGEEGKRVEMEWRDNHREKLKEQDRFLGSLAELTSLSTRAESVGHHWKCPICDYEARE